MAEQTHQLYITKNVKTMCVKGKGWEREGHGV